ncbi:MAG: hypothetical protein KDC97_03860 [Confluentibacter sp.]|nr:hypothetical protein [Confluentibacter sp.]
MNQIQAITYMVTGCYLVGFGFEKFLLKKSAATISSKFNENLEYGVIVFS